MHLLHRQGPAGMPDPAAADHRRQSSDRAHRLPRDHQPRHRADEEPRRASTRADAAGRLHRRTQAELPLDIVQRSEAAVQGLLASSRVMLIPLASHRSCL